MKVGLKALCTNPYLGLTVTQRQKDAIQRGIFYFNLGQLKIQPLHRPVSI